MRRKQALSQLMLLAQECLQKKQPKNSIKILQQVLQVQPKNSQAYRILADCYDELGQKQQAQINYKISIDCNPFSTISYVNYGLLLYNWDKKVQAEKVYQQCLAIDDSDKIVLNNYGILLFQLRKYEDAEHIFKRCLKIDPDNENCQTYLKKIQNQKQKSNPDKAEPLSQQEKLVQLLLQRDQKLQQKEEELLHLRTELLKKEKQIASLKLQLKKMKKQKIDEGALRFCKICLNKTAIFANKKCGHLTSCRDCLPVIGKNCPLCRTLGSFIRVYSSLIKEEEGQ